MKTYCYLMKNVSCKWLICSMLHMSSLLERVLWSSFCEDIYPSNKAVWRYSSEFQYPISLLLTSTSIAFRSILCSTLSLPFFRKVLWIKEFTILWVCLKLTINLHVLDFHLRNLTEHPPLDTLTKDCNINNQ